MEEKNKYKPISCNYYDHLEAIATLGKKVPIRYWDDREKEITIDGRIIDFQIAQEVEYLILAEGISIRLDRLISVDQLLLSEFKTC